MVKKILFSLACATTSLLAAPQAIVFDFGGVMTGEPNRQAVVNFICDSFHFSEAEFEIVNRQKKTVGQNG